MRKGQIFTYDLETTATETPQIYSWGLMTDDKSYYDGIRDYEFIELLESFDRDYVGYARNGSKFDAHFIKDLLTRHGYTQKIFDSKFLECIMESDYKIENVDLDSKDKLLKPKEYSLMVDGNFKIMEIKIGLPSFKITNGEKKYRVVRLRDSNLIFGGSIKSIGETLNRHYNTDKYSKGEGDTGISYNRTELYNSIEEWDKDGNERSYLKQDCFIDLSYLLMVMEKFPFNKWKLTSASTAYSQWLDIYGESLENVLVEKGTLERVKPTNASEKDEFYKLRYKGREHLHSTTNLRKNLALKSFPTSWLDDKDENETYLFNRIYRYMRGGITQANPDYVGIKIDDINITDIVSAYPSVMNSDLLYPFGNPFIGDGGDDYPVKFLRVEMLSDNINEKGLPFIPILNQKSLSYEYRNKLDKYSVFYLTDYEYERFKKYYKGKHIAEVEFSFKGISGKKIFGDYINKYFQMKSDGKKNGDEGETLIAKLFLNSLYGKFATKTLRTSRVWNDKDLEWEKEQVLVSSKFYLPIAVLITTYARMKLVDAVHENYNDFVYCDTDSIFFRGKEIFNNITLSKELGDWELEYENMEGIAIRPKQYLFQDSKGKKKVGLAGINLFREDKDSDDKIYLETLEFNHLISGRSIHNQLKPKRYLGYGIRLEETIKEIKPIWDKPPLYNQWFTTYDEYVENYEKQKEKIISKKL